MTQEQSFCRQNRAASLTGYGMIVGLIAIVGIVAVQTVGDNVTELFGGVSEQMSGITGGTEPVDSEENGEELPDPDPATLSTPQISFSGLDVTGPGDPALGTPVVLTFSNEGDLSTDALSTELDDDTNFFISDNNCNGFSLAGGSDCQVEITPQATEDGAMAAILTVTDGSLSVNVSLSGTASDFTPPQGPGYGWGSAGSGRLGNNTTSGSFATAQAVSGAQQWIDIRTGSTHSCGVNASGIGYCWGQAINGKLGNNQTLGSFGTPQLVLGGHNWVAIDAGDGHSCGIDTTGAARCWGLASNGKLGNGNSGATTAFPTPSLVSSGYSWVKISVNVSHSCGIDTDNIARCWGLANDGRLGNNVSSGTYATPQPVWGDYEWLEISAGSIHSCGIDVDNIARCWGNALDGRLGNNVTTTTAYPSPQLVLGEHSWTKISAGATHTCGIDTTGAARCWGLALNGKLGNNVSSTAQFGIPQLVHNGHSWTQISAGTSHTCGIDDTGTARCWGLAQNGRLGNNVSSSTIYATPQLVLGGLSWHKISAGEVQTLAVAQ